MVLPELPKLVTTNAFFSVTAGIDRNIISKQLEWFHHWQSPDGEVCISCARLADSYVLRFPRLVDFVISDANKFVQYFPVDNVPVETIRHLLLDQIIPRILGQQGRLVIHASSVILPNNKAIAFLGNSGCGKSTIASFFCNTGARLLTDDCLLIDVHDDAVVGIPSYCGLRLYEDSIHAIYNQNCEFSSMAHYSEKKRLLQYNNQTMEPPFAEKLDAIFLLGEPGKNIHSDGVSVEQIRGSRELMVMVEQMFLLDVTDMNLVAKHFQSLGEIIATGIPIYRLEYPRKHSLLPTVKASVNNVLS